MNYIKRPIKVTAMQWTGNNLDFISEFMIGADKVLSATVEGDLKLFSLDGYMTAHKGDWIIRTEMGEVYPCSKESFERIYERV